MQISSLLFPILFIKYKAYIMKYIKCQEKLTDCFGFSKKSNWNLISLFISKSYNDKSNILYFALLLYFI